MRRPLALLAVALCLLPVAGCHEETPDEAAAREFRKAQKDRMSVAKLNTGLYRMLTEQQIVRANDRDGLALALQPLDVEVRVGQSVRVRLLYANLSAFEPVSATSCQGFSLVAEDAATGAAQTAPLAFDCSKEGALLNNKTELQRGQVRASAISTAGTPLRFDHPGSYLVMATWQSYRPAEDAVLLPTHYHAIESNSLLVTVE